MPTHQTVIVFALVTAGMMLMPGPSNFFLLAHGISHGRRAALAAMTGIQAASAIRILLTVVGLSAILARSPIALGVLHWAGVAYLAYLGSRRSAPRSQTSRPSTWAHPCRGAGRRARD